MSYLAETLQRQAFSQSLKCSVQDLSVDLQDMRETQIYPFFQPILHLWFVLLVWLCSKVAYIAKDLIRLLPYDQSDPGE